MKFSLMKKIISSIALLSFFFLSCKKETIEEELQLTPEEVCPNHSVIKNGLYYHDAMDDTYLWGGDDPSSHFKINNFKLDPCNLRYGLGREHFPALIEPQYQPLSEVADHFDDVEKTLILRAGVDLKVYPFSILVKHELLNEKVGNQPVSIVYCFLANLAAVYSRKYCNRELTFGVSGYTYLDDDIQNGLESFVLWDRETESLWWPILGKGVSGAFANKSMELHDEAMWEEMRWADVKINFPNAIVLKDNQTMEPPENWNQILSSEIICL